MKRLNNKGFGVMSLLIGLSALMILSVMVIPTVSQMMTNGQVTGMESTVTNLQTDVQNYVGSGGSFTTLGIGSTMGSSAINGLQSAAYKYLVPVSWTPNTVLNASYTNLTAQNGWYNLPNSGFATAYLVTTGSNIFTSDTTPPEFALGLYAPQMTNGQANTVINYIESKEPGGAFDEFMWNGSEYTWNSTNKNFENSSNQTIPLNTVTGNGQLIFGFNGYLQTVAASGGLTYTQPDPAVYDTPGQYQFTIPESTITITCGGASGGNGGSGYGFSGMIGGEGATNTQTFTGLTPGSILTLYVGASASGIGGGGNGSAGGYGGYGGGSGFSGGGGASSVWLNGSVLIAAGGGGGATLCGTNGNWAGHPGGNATGSAGGMGGGIGNSYCAEGSYGGGGGGGGSMGIYQNGGAGAGVTGNIGLNSGEIGNKYINGHNDNYVTNLTVSSGSNGYIEISW